MPDFTRTHVELDDAVLTQVMQLGGFSTKKDAVNAALSELARALKRHELLRLRGKVRWDGDLAALRAPRGAGKPRK